MKTDWAATTVFYDDGRTRTSVEHIWVGTSTQVPTTLCGRPYPTPPNNAVVQWDSNQDRCKRCEKILARNS